jgi:hypothetical protein
VATNTVRTLRIASAREATPGTGSPYEPVLPEVEIRAGAQYQRRIDPARTYRRWSSSGRRRPLVRHRIAVADAPSCWAHLLLSVVLIGVGALVVIEVLTG